MLSLERVLSPRHIRALVAALIGALCALTIAFNGKHGLYLFDEGISYQMGWLIWNGWRPFVDFPTPLMPLSGLVTALGFSCFGVTYFSGVFVTVALAAAAFWIIAVNLCRVLPFGLAMIGAALSLLTSVAYVGVPYYNHLSALIVCVAASFLIKHAADEQSVPSARSRVALFASLAALLTCKLHVGAMFLLLTAALETTWIRSFMRTTWRKRFVWVATIALPPLVALLALLTWIGFDLRALLDNVFNTADRTIYWASIDAMVQHRIDIMAQPQFGIAFTTAVPLVAGIAAFAYRRGSWTILRLTLIGVGLAAAYFPCAMLSAEAPSLACHIQVLSILCGYLIVHRAKLPDVRDSETLDPAAILCLPMLLAIGWFSALYIMSGQRKTYDEPTQGYPPQNVKISTVQTSLPFLRHIGVRSDQKAVLDAIHDLRQSNPGLSIFYGGGFEMLYAATGDLPPHGWPLWLHIGLSVQPRQFPAMTAAFLEQHYDLVMLSHDRLWMTEFLTHELEQRYRRVPISVGWLEVLVRKELPDPVMTTAKSH